MNRRDFAHQIGIVSVGAHAHAAILAELHTMRLHEDMDTIVIINSEDIAEDVLHAALLEYGRQHPVLVINTILEEKQDDFAKKLFLIAEERLLDTSNEIMLLFQQEKTWHVPFYAPALPARPYSVRLPRTIRARSHL